MLETRAFAAQSPQTPLSPFTFTRREPREHDVLVKIAYCGVCHSDIHQARDEWGGATFPMVPGHEIVGRVERVGSAVTRHRVGDVVGLGCFVDSCRTCDACKRGLEQYCERHVVWTYNGTEHDGTPTQGGYSTQIVAHEDYVLRVSDALPLHAVAPLLCAGITTWSPLRHWKVGKGTRVGVVGLGGLGHMAVKLAASLGADVTVISSSPRKRDDATRLGAHDFLVSSDPKALAAAKGRFDFILDTVSAVHSLDTQAGLLRTDGTMVLVGAPEKAASLNAFSLITGRRSIAGSLIGGIRETQEMLDYCAAHGVVADVEVLPVAAVNEAYARMLKSDVRYRFVLDIESLRSS